jgi:hypothetical protein
MTTRDTKLLFSDWISHLETPPLYSRWKWAFMKWAATLLGQPSCLRDRSDYGLEMLPLLRLSGATSPLLERPAFNWLRLALAAIGTPGANHVDGPEIQVVREAIDLHFHSYSRRLPLQAALLARDSTAESVAAALRLSPQFVEAYADIFHNVLVRKRDWFYRRKAARSALSRPGSIYMPEKVHPDDDALIRTGLKGTLADVMLLVKRQGRVLETVN